MLNVVLNLFYFIIFSFADLTQQTYFPMKKVINTTHKKSTCLRILLLFVFASNYFFHSVAYLGRGILGTYPPCQGEVKEENDL